MTEKINKTTKPRRPRKPTIHETRQQMAETGDVEGLWQVLGITDWTMFDHEKTFSQLLRAIATGPQASGPEKWLPSHALLPRPIRL